MNIDNQSDYWDAVAQFKQFTHPLNISNIETYIQPGSEILDYGCGYGRLVGELLALGYQKVKGYDTSSELVKRGRSVNDLPLFHIPNPTDLPIEDETVDCILLFAVLTCIPSNKGQVELIDLLHSKLKPGGIIYVSDYYLQKDSKELERYEKLDGDPENFGVFTLPDGATFRHHPKDWIARLLKKFTILQEKEIEVMTMNGHVASGFQLVARK